MTKRLLGDEAHISYSQEGEDVVLRRYLDVSKPGYYVDIGAHHPTRYSNTKYYYDRGWNGINVDADPSLVEEFKLQRPRDINVMSGAGTKSGGMIFYKFNHPAINTFDEKIAKKRDKLEEFEIVETIKVKVRPLAELLKQHLPKGQKINFMTIDVEGRDLDVIRSNDWKIYRPEFVMVECLEAVESLEAVLTDKVTVFLRKVGYQPIAKTLYTVIYGAIHE